MKCAEKVENALKADHRELAKAILTKSKITKQASFKVISAWQTQFQLLRFMPVLT